MAAYAFSRFRFRGRRMGMLALLLIQMFPQLLAVVAIYLIVFNVGDVFHVIGLNIGILIQAAPQIFGEVMGEMFGLIAAGVLTPGQPTAYELADGPKALTELEARATVGKLALLP